ncbi:MAG: hypothetical protein FJ271_01075 [Planctomycetes bacterium]|nr:hypothetical protein [Planctomycetota bacterium]
MIVTKEANAEPIPGYRLIEPLGSGGFGEVWKCEAPGGLFKAVKFVFGERDSLSGDSDRAEEELRAVQHIKALRHPFLLSMDRVECIDGELVIVMELADQNLHELLTQYQKAGKQGIPRKELLGYLREAAEVLDLMNQQHQLQHLDIKPRNLFLVSNHVKVADFGLVNSLTAHADQSVQLGAITPIYASPEVFLGRPSSFSDQYSLAIVYQELLTGTLPFEGKNGRQLLLQHTKMEPNLKALPASERATVGRALAKEPENRFPSCKDFIEALSGEPSAAHLLPTSPAKKSTPTRPTEETAANLAKDTLSLRKDAPIPRDLLPGYRFGECLGRSTLVDKWLVERPDGKQRLLQILYGCPSGARLEQAVARLRSLQYPGLKEAEIVSADTGRIILLTGLVKETLRDRAQQCQARKQPGIMRGELLEYLGYAAETLDYLYEQHSIQHLCLNPRNLALLRDGRVQIIGYGLAQLLWLPGGQAVAHVNGRYAAPELFQPKVGRACDQYSLALIYHEMLTGAFPFKGTTAVSGSARLTVPPDLDRLPEPDREVIARALDPDPHKRWPSCAALIRALDGTKSEVESVARGNSDSFIKRVSESRAAPNTIPVQTQENLNQIIAEMIEAAGGEGQGGDRTDAAPTLSRDGEVLQHKFLAGLPLGSARLRLESFCQQWYGQLIREDERGCGFTVNMPRNFWNHWIGRQPALEVQVILDRPNPLATTPIEVGVQVRALGCSRKRAAQLLQEMGPSLRENLRAHLLVNSERRTQDRLLWPHALKVQPLYLDGRKGSVIECQGKDLSTSGIGFFLPNELDTSEVLIELPSNVHPPSVSVPATLVRAKRCADGTYEVGALFRLPGLRQTRAPNRSHFSAS